MTRGEKMTNEHDRAARLAVEGVVISSASKGYNDNVPREVGSLAGFGDYNLEIDFHVWAIERRAKEHIQDRSNPSRPQPSRAIQQRLVIIESPLAGDVEANMAYARACLLDSLRRGEAPIASHLLHTQVLDDLKPDERLLGIEAGLAWYRVADRCIVYGDRGISAGMRAGIGHAALNGVRVETRFIEKGQGGHREVAE